MKKIINWTFGSVFRTFGRILAYIGVGMLFALILSKKDIKITDLLGIQRVNAATNVTVNSWGHNLGYYTGTADDPVYNTTGWFTGDKSLPAGNLGLYLDSLRVIYSNALSTANTYNITFDSYYNPRSSLDIFKRARITFTGSSTGSNSGTSEAAIKNGVCIPGISEGTATKVTWSCSFQPTIALNYMRIEIYFDDLYYLQSYGSLKPVVIFDNAQVDAITNQTLIIQQETEIINNSINDLNDNIMDDDTSDAENEAGSFFENFTTNTHGLTSIITAPLTAIESLTSKSCSPLVLPLPFVDEDLTLPCMRPIYEENFGGFMTLYDAITLGIVSYWILVRIFALVKDFKNPDHDEIEVVDL